MAVQVALDSNIVLTGAEILVNSDFPTNKLGWTDADNAFLYVEGGGIEFDTGVSGTHTLTQEVTLYLGWYRLGMYTTGIGVASIALSTLAASTVAASGEELQQYFYVDAELVDDVVITGNSISWMGMINSVSLQRVSAFNPSYSVEVTNQVQGGTRTIYEMRGLTDWSDTDEPVSQYFGKGVGNTSFGNKNIGIGSNFNLIGDNRFGLAVGDEKFLQYGDIENRQLAVGYNSDADPEDALVALTAITGTLSLANGIIVNEREEGDGSIVKGDIWFAGTSSGFPFGSFYGNDIAKVFTAAVQNTWNLIADTDATDGQLNLVTHDGSGKMTVSKAGKYLVTYSVSVDSSLQNKLIESGIAVTGTVASDGRARYQVIDDSGGVGTDFCLSSTAILTLAASATLEVAVRTTDTGTPDLTVSFVNMSVMQVGS